MLGRESRRRSLVGKIQSSVAQGTEGQLTWWHSSIRYASRLRALRSYNPRTRVVPKLGEWVILTSAQGECKHQIWASPDSWYRTSRLGGVWRVNILILWITIEVVVCMKSMDVYVQSIDGKHNVLEFVIWQRMEWQEGRETTQGKLWWLSWVKL